MNYAIKIRTSTLRTLAFQLFRFTQLPHCLVEVILINGIAVVFYGGKTRFGDDVAQVSSVETIRHFHYRFEIYFAFCPYPRGMDFENF